MLFSVCPCLLCFMWEIILSLEVLIRKTSFTVLAPPILKRGTRWICVVIFILRPLYPNRKAPGTCPRAGLVGLGAGLDVLEKKKLCLAGRRKNFLSSPVITLSTLSHDRVHHVKRGCGFHMLTEPVMSILGVWTLLKHETGNRTSFWTPFRVGTHL